MGYSFYEIYITAQRAFRAMGFPFGADEDAAFIIAWLELNNFNGIELLTKTIKKIDGNYNGKLIIKNLDQQINFKDQSVLMTGPGLVDYLQTFLNKEKKIFINNAAG